MNIRFISNLRLLRALKDEERGILPLYVVAQEADVPRGWLTKLERGQATVIELDRIEKLCRYFHCDPIQIVQVVAFEEVVEHA